MIFRVVMDTNLIISAFLWGGIPKNLFNSVIEHSIPLLMSVEMMAELERTLRKPKLAPRFTDQSTSIEKVVDEFMPLVTIVQSSPIPDGVVRDPKDHMIIAAAVGGKATHLISGDKDLTSLGRYEITDIVTATQFLALLHKPPSPSE